MTTSVTMDLDEIAENLDTERMTIGEENGCIVLRVPATSANRAIAAEVLAKEMQNKILRQHNLIVESVDVINNLLAAARTFDDVRTPENQVRVANAVRKSELYIEKTILEARR